MVCRAPGCYREFYWSDAIKHAGEGEESDVVPVVRRGMWRRFADWFLGHLLDF